MSSLFDTRMRKSPLTIGHHILEWGKRTYVMGILNITPDSFSGDGLLSSQDVAESAASSNASWVEAALEQAKSFVSAGADILDVGGESTRPGAQPVGLEQEMARVVPVIQVLAANMDVLISVDTYRARVAEAAIRAGAGLINDVWGFHADPELAAVAACYNVPAVLMHNRSSWVHAEIKERLGGRYVGVPYENLLEDIKRELMESAKIALEAGVPEEHIILDPGIGFGKTVRQNLELINRLDEICALGFPVLLGPSRKSFIGYTLDLPPDQRVEGTAAAVSVGIARGADMVRVHDVDQMVRVVQMADAIVREANLRSEGPGK